jgi:GGDEF domain-containing protein
MPPATPRRRRARPVADAPIDSLLTRSEDLAKGWLLALLEQSSLDDAPGILAADLSRDGPRICDAVLRAIADDTDLRRLEAGGALRALAGRAGELAGATAPGAISRAVDALGAVVWSALRDELRGPDPDLVVELTERLTLVIELVRAAALDRASAMPPGDAGPGAGARAGGPERGLSAVPHPESGSGSPPAEATAEATGEALWEPPARPWPDLHGPSSTDAPPVPEALWVGALDDEIRRAGASPLSLLLTELEDVERVTAVETSAKASATFGEFAQAVRSVVRRQDILVCETDTRAWIIARDTARAGAQALGSRIADAVGAAPPWRGAPLVASVGAAVLGEDGRSAAELIESAEVARFGFATGADEVDGGEDG